MTTSLTLASLVPLLPEIILAAGAMALLMLGVYRTPRTETLIDVLSIILLIIAGVAVVVLPAGKLTAFGGRFCVGGFARLLPGAAHRRPGSAIPTARYD